MSAPALNPRELSSQDLRRLLETYLASFETLQQSQEALRRQVADLAQELEQKNALLARRNRLAELGEMAAGVAHEIRNPLGGIRLYAGLLERDLSQDPERLQLVGRIRTGVEQLDRIVREMLDFTRQMVLERREADPAQMAEEALGFALPDPGAAIRIRREFAPDLRASVDVHHLRRALLNLLINAVEAMPQGGELGLVTAPALLEGRPAVEIRIEDTGAGIPREALPKLFDPFFTTKAQGTGLGLAFVQRVVEAHGGSVEALNRPQGGAAFRLRLPTEGNR
jgi:signal transduction histidine kinase